MASSLSMTESPPKRAIEVDFREWCGTIDVKTVEVEDKEGVENDKVQRMSRVGHVVQAHSRLQEPLPRRARVVVGGPDEE